MPATGGTAMDPDQEKRLLAKWNCSGLWPAVAEQETSVMGVPGDAHILNHFCPEVMYLRFGIFASDSARYADELDAEFAHKGLAREGASSYDPRWHWAYAREIHFSECDLYSPLFHGASDPGKAFVGEEVLELKPGAFGFSLNLKALWKKARMWYERRQGGA